MKRISVIVAAFAMLAAACGSDSSTSTSALDELTAGEAACYNAEFDRLGLDMDEILSTAVAELSDSERQASLDIAAACEGADGVLDTDADTTDGTSYDDLSPLEQAFVDGMTEAGVSEAAGICVLGALQDDGFTIEELAGFGLSGEEPPMEMMSAIFSCGDELFEDLEDFSDFGEFDSDVNTYGDDATLDALWDACEQGDGQACDDLYFQSPLGSEYESFGDTCGGQVLDSPVFSCVDELSDTDGGEPVAGGSYGDDAGLDALWDDCAAGDGWACDDLFFDSPFDSEYELFGDTCGEQATAGTVYCAVFLGSGGYGDDPALDALWDDCAAGDYEACDDLYWQSPIGSAYEGYGATCGELARPIADQCVTRLSEDA